LEAHCGDAAVAVLVLPWTVHVNAAVPSQVTTKLLWFVPPRKELGWPRLAGEGLNALLAGMGLVTVDVSEFV
jgi:hypothetical protein